MVQRNAIKRILSFCKQSSLWSFVAVAHYTVLTTSIKSYYIYSCSFKVTVLVAIYACAPCYYHIYILLFFHPSVCSLLAPCVRELYFVVCRCEAIKTINKQHVILPPNLPKAASKSRLDFFQVYLTSSTFWGHLQIIDASATAQHFSLALKKPIKWRSKSTLKVAVYFRKKNECSTKTWWPLTLP